MIKAKCCEHMNGWLERNYKLKFDFKKVKIFHAHDNSKKLCKTAKILPQDATSLQHFLALL